MEVLSSVERLGGPITENPNDAFSAATSGAAQEVPYRSDMEQAFGQDFGGVDAHVGQADALGAISAHGAAKGESVAFASSQPDVATVAHELTHVVQSRGGTDGGVQGRGGVSDPGSAAEVEAERVAQTVAAGGRAEVSSAAAPGAIHRWFSEEFKADLASRNAEPTTATREKDYRPTGDLAIKVGDNHWRIWGFEVGSDDLPNNTQATLIEIGLIVQKDPTAQVHFRGHTSASGTEAGNIALSMSRAQAVINRMKLLWIDTTNFIPYQDGETSPLVDETQGPAAMARNRRVEIFLMPGTSVAASTTKDTKDAKDTTEPLPPRRDCHITRGEADLNRRLALAEAQMWTLLEAKGLHNGRPTLGFGETSAHPDELEWDMACAGNGVPQAWADTVYDSLYFPVDGNMLQKINTLNSEAAMYADILAGDDCDPDESFPQPPRLFKGVQKDPMPGDQDPKGRMH